MSSKDDSLGARYAESLSENRALREQVRSLQSRLEKQDRMIETLSVLASKKPRVKEFVSQVDVARSVLVSMENDVHKYRKQVQQMEMKLTMAGDKYRKLENVLKKEQNRHMRWESKRNESLLAKEHAFNDDLQKLREKYEKTIVMLRHDVRKLRKVVHSGIRVCPSCEAVHVAEQRAEEERERLHRQQNPRQHRREEIKRELLQRELEDQRRSKFRSISTGIPQAVLSPRNVSMDLQVQRAGSPPPSTATTLANAAFNKFINAIHWVLNRTPHTKINAMEYVPAQVGGASPDSSSESAMRYKIPKGASVQRISFSSECFCGGHSKPSSEGDEMTTPTRQMENGLRHMMEGDDGSLVVDVPSPHSGHRTVGGDASNKRRVAVFRRAKALGLSEAASMSVMQKHGVYLAPLDLEEAYVKRIESLSWETEEVRSEMAEAQQRVRFLEDYVRAHVVSELVTLPTARERRRRGGVINVPEKAAGNVPEGLGLGEAKEIANDSSGVQRLGSWQQRVQSQLKKGAEALLSVERYRVLLKYMVVATFVRMYRHKAALKKFLKVTIGIVDFVNTLDRMIIESSGQIPDDAGSESGSEIKGALTERDAMEGNVDGMQWLKEANVLVLTPWRDTSYRMFMDKLYEASSVIRSVVRRCYNTLNRQKVTMKSFFARNIRLSAAKLEVESQLRDAEVELGNLRDSLKFQTDLANEMQTRCDGMQRTIASRSKRKAAVSEKKQMLARLLREGKIRSSTDFHSFDEFLKMEKAKKRDPAVQAAQELAASPFANTMPPLFMPQFSGMSPVSSWGGPNCISPSQRALKSQGRRSTTAQESKHRSRFSWRVSPTAAAGPQPTQVDGGGTQGAIPPTPRLLKRMYNSMQKRQAAEVANAQRGTDGGVKSSRRGRRHASSPAQQPQTGANPYAMFPFLPSPQPLTLDLAVESPSSPSSTSASATPKEPVTQRTPISEDEEVYTIRRGDQR